MPNAGIHWQDKYPGNEQQLERLGQDHYVTIGDPDNSPESRLPALSLLPGQSLAHFAR
jgi:hypothetical protein